MRDSPTRDREAHGGLPQKRGDSSGQEGGSPLALEFHGGAPRGSVGPSAVPAGRTAQEHGPNLARCGISLEVEAEPAAGEMTSVEAAVEVVVAEAVHFPVHYRSEGRTGGN